MRKLATILMILVPILHGCAGDQHNAFMPPQPDPLFSNPTLPAPPTTKPKLPAAEIVQSPGDGATKAAIEELRTQSNASNNQNQQNFSGLGAQIAKVADTMQGFGGDLAHINASIQNSLSATATVGAAINASAQMQASATANLRAQITADVSASISATLHNELSAVLTNNATMTNQAIGKMQETIDKSVQALELSATAGRDAIQNTTQFSKEMRDVLTKSYETTLDSERSSNKWNYWTIVAFLGLISTIFAGTVRALGKKDRLLYENTEQSRRRAEERHREEKLRAHRLENQLIPEPRRNSVQRDPLPSEPPVFIDPAPRLPAAEQEPQNANSI